MVFIFVNIYCICVDTIVAIISKHCRICCCCSYSCSYSFCCCSWNNCCDCYVISLILTTSLMLLLYLLLNKPNPLTDVLVVVVVDDIWYIRYDGGYLYANKCCYVLVFYNKQSQSRRASVHELVFLFVRIYCTCFDTIAVVIFRIHHICCCSVCCCYWNDLCNRGGVSLTLTMGLVLLHPLLTKLHPLTQLLLSLLYYCVVFTIINVEEFNGYYLHYQKTLLHCHIVRKHPFWSF